MNKLYRLVVLWIGILMGAKSAMAISNPCTLTLKDAIFLALRHNPQIQSANFTQVLNKFNLLTARNQFDLQYAITGSANAAQFGSGHRILRQQQYSLTPTVSLLTAFGGTATLSMENNSDGKTYSPGGTFTYTQPLIRGMRPSIVKTPLFNAQDQLLIGRLQLQDTVVTTVTEVTISYLNLVAIENSLKIQEDSLKRAQENVLRTKKQIKAGSVAPVAIYQAKQNVAQNQLAILQQKNILEQARQSLLTNIGIDPLLNIIVPKSLDIPYYKIYDKEQSIKIALANNPAYQADLISTRIARRNLLVAKDNQLWQLNATYSGSINGVFGNQFDGSASDLLVNNINNYQSGALTLTIPLHNYQLKQTEVAAKIALDQQEIQNETMKRQIMTNVINAIQSIITSSESIKVAKNNVKLAQHNLETAYKEFNYGRINMLQVTQQQDVLTMAQQQALATKAEYLSAIANYEQLLQINLKHWNIKLRD